MNNVYLKYKKENNFHNWILYSIIPLILYGFYKNSYLLYQEGLVDILVALKPILLLVITALLLYLFSKIKSKLNLEKNYMWMVILLFIPFSVNIYLYAICLFIFMTLEIILKDKTKVIFPILFKLVLALVLIYLNSYSYLNTSEILYSYNYNFLDIFIGKGFGSLFSSNVLLVILSFLILSTNFYYKKYIPLISSGVYFSITILLSFFIIIDFASIPYGYILLVTIYLLPNFLTSPYILNKQIVYSVMFSLLAIVFTIITNPYEGIFIAILLTIFLSKLLKLTN